jgi:hypothetical protein
MLNTFIKNRGSSQTITHINNQNQFNETDWDIDYDGNMANISVNTNIDGNNKQYNISLDNDDLASMLNIPSVNMPIDKRLQLDFGYNNQSTYRKPIKSVKHVKSVKAIKHKNYLSSPQINEEFIVPISIHSNTSAPNKRKKTHKTYKIYKKIKSSPKSKSSTKSKSHKKYHSL